MRTIYSRKGLAKHLKISAATLSVWEKNGYIPKPVYKRTNGRPFWTCYQAKSITKGEYKSLHGPEPEIIYVKNQVNLETAKRANLQDTEGIYYWLKEDLVKPKKEKQITDPNIPEEQPRLRTENQRYLDTLAKAVDVQFQPLDEPLPGKGVYTSGIFKRELECWFVSTWDDTLKIQDSVDRCLVVDRSDRGIAEQVRAFLDQV